MIKHLYNQGVPKARIASQLGLNPKTVDKAIKEDKPPQHERHPRNSILDPYKDYIRQKLDKYDLTATRILRDIKEQGYPGSYTILRYFVKQVKGDKPKPAFVRFETPPGEQAQADWSDFGYMEFDGKRTKLWCFSMILGYSRTLYIQFFSSQNLVSLCQGHIQAFKYFGGITDTILYDNMKAIVLSREDDKILWNPQFMDFANYYGFIPKLCLPGRKETKGKVERPFSYIRTSFFAGESFTGFSHLNEKARNWLDNVANVRIHATTGAVPFDRLKGENLHPLNESDYSLEQSETRKSSKDCYISFEGNRYSIPYLYSCRDLTVKLKGDDLRIFYGDQLIADHKISCQKGQMITDKKHFYGIPKPAYPIGIRAIREMFLSSFPKANPFVDGLVSSKYGNARYHMQRILNLLDEYSPSVVSAAIERASLFGAFNYGVIRNICHQMGRPDLGSGEIELTQNMPLTEQAVEERSLSYYSELEG